MNETALYTVVGALVVAQLAGLLAGFVKWLGSRTVEQEDKEKASIRADIKAHEERFDELDKAVRDMDRTVLTVQNDVRQMNTSVENIRGNVAALQSTLETRLDKQAEFYRAQLKDTLEQVNDSLARMESDLRRDSRSPRKR